MPWPKAAGGLYVSSISRNWYVDCAAEDHSARGRDVSVASSESWNWTEAAVVKQNHAAIELQTQACLTAGRV